MQNLLTNIPPRRLAQFGLALAALTLIIVLITSAGRAITPFAIGLIIAYLLSPSVNRLSAFLPRWAAVMLMYLVVALIGTLLVIFIVPALVNQVERLIQNAPSISTLQTWISRGVQEYHELTPDALEPFIERTIASALSSLQENASTLARNAFSFVGARITQILGVLGFVVGLLILPVWVFYLLNEQRRMLAFVNRLLNYAIRADVWHVVRIVDRSLSAYLRGQLTLGLIIGVAVGVALGIADLVPGVDVDYILLLAIWAGICELVPMVGALLGMIPGVIIAGVLGGPVSAVTVAVIYIVIQQIENNVLVPRIIGDAVGVHPAILTVTLLIGASLFGLPGVILAAPATAVARDLYLYTYRRLGGASADEAMQSVS
jgi:predicted PurR-regulated permease PerM